MSLNTNMVNCPGPIYAKAISLDSVQKKHCFELPLDVIPSILKKLPVTEIFNLGLVCKDWRTIVDSDDFQNELILPPNFNGPQRWKEYTKADVGKTPALPLWIFKCMEKGGHMLTFIPETVQIKKDDGTVSKIALTCLEAVGNLFANTLIETRKVGISSSNPSNWPSSYINIGMRLEKGHWVLISKKAMGGGLNYQQQADQAKKVGPTMSEPIDTVISFFMEYLRTGMRYANRVGMYGQEMLSIRVDAIKYRMCLGFYLSKICVSGCDDMIAEQDLAFYPARKFFGGADRNC